MCMILSRGDWANSHQMSVPTTKRMYVLRVDRLSPNAEKCHEHIELKLNKQTNYQVLYSNKTMILYNLILKLLEIPLLRHEI